MDIKGGDWENVLVSSLFVMFQHRQTNSVWTLAVVKLFGNKSSSNNCSQLKKKQQSENMFDQFASRGQQNNWNIFVWHLKQKITFLIQMQFIYKCFAVELRPK